MQTTSPPKQRLLGERLGFTIHQSALRWKIKALMRNSGIKQDVSEEEWLVELANRRQLKAVICANETLQTLNMPDEQVLSTEELITALCLLQSMDQPQMLRLAAQGISRGNSEIPSLLRLAEMERIQSVLEELAKTALKVEPSHPAWTKIANAFANAKPLKEPLLHWTRLAEPVMTPLGVNASTWRLIA